jgi:uncharacterized protein YbbC (DUF1343 family)
VRVLQRWLVLPVVVVVSAAALVVAEQRRQSRVRPGIDVLLTDSAHLIAGKRVGLITNATGVDARGVLTLDRLWAASRGTANGEPRTAPRLVALFAPEHHFAATLRPGETFGDSIEPRTGLPIYSLYGANRAPTPEQFARFDVLVIDMQDVGARPFTYISTAIRSMQAAARAGTRVIALDRPNPVGCAMQGPVLDTAHASFIGLLPVPLRHGLTFGELARLANAELAIGADLVVVPVQGWRRCDWFEATGLPWVRPSPNLPNMRSVEWYPGTVLFEATNLSVGRGTDAPFRQVGAPWLNQAQVVREAQRRGVRVGLTTFTPQSPGDGKYPGQEVRGVILPIMERDTADPVATALTLLDAIAAVHPGSLRVDTAGLTIRLGVRRPPGRVSWSYEVEQFRRRVAPYLLY